MSTPAVNCLFGSSCTKQGAECNRPGHDLPLDQERINKFNENKNRHQQNKRGGRDHPTFQATTAGAVAQQRRPIQTINFSPISVSTAPASQQRVHVSQPLSASSHAGGYRNFVPNLNHPNIQHATHAEQLPKKNCVYGYNCTKNTPQHLALFNHECEIDYKGIGALQVMLGRREPQPCMFGNRCEIFFGRETPDSIVHNVAYHHDCQIDYDRITKVNENRKQRRLEASKEVEQSGGVTFSFQTGPSAADQLRQVLSAQTVVTVNAPQPEVKRPAEQQYDKKLVCDALLQSLKNGKNTPPATEVTYASVAATDATTELAAEPAATAEPAAATAAEPAAAAAEPAAAEPAEPAATAEPTVTVAEPAAEPAAAEPAAAVAEPAAAVAEPAAAGPVAGVESETWGDEPVDEL